MPDKKTVKNGCRGIPGPGRPKGSENKFTNLKESFLEAFRETGGAAGMIEWINKSPHNRGQFYGMITKMLPANVTVDGSMEIVMNISEGFKPQVKK